MAEPFESLADGYVKWLRAHVGSQLIYLVYATILVFDDAGRLLVQRRYDFDWLGVPGGALEVGEGLRECAIRETREETGLDVTVERLVGVFSHPEFNLLYPNGDRVQQWTACVVARPVGGTLEADGGETLGVQWMNVDDAMPHLPRPYQAMVRAALESPHEAVLEPVEARTPLVPYYPILREHVGHAPIILPGAMAVIRDDAGRVLVVRRRDDGTRDIPSGFADLGETSTATAVREVYEETGLHVEPVRVMGVYSEGMQSTCGNGDQIHAVGIAFECRITGGTLLDSSDEISDLEFMAPSDLLTLPAPTPGIAQMWRDINQPDRWPVLR